MADQLGLVRRVCWTPLHSRAVFVFDTVSLAFWLFGAATLALAYFVRGVAGFGSGLIAIPLLALVLPLTLVVPLVVFLDYVASASHGLKDRAQIQWHQIFPLLPFTALGVLTGLYLFQAIDSVLLAHALGVFVVLYAIYSLLAKDGDSKASWLWAVPAGGLGVKPRADVEQRNSDGAGHQHAGDGGQICGVSLVDQRPGYDACRQSGKAADRQQQAGAVLGDTGVNRVADDESPESIASAGAEPHRHGQENQQWNWSGGTVLIPRAPAGRRRVECVRSFAAGYRDDCDKRHDHSGEEPPAPPNGQGDRGHCQTCQ